MTSRAGFAGPLFRLASRTRISPLPVKMQTEPSDSIEETAPGILLSKLRI